MNRITVYAALFGVAIVIALAGRTLFAPDHSPFDPTVPGAPPPVVKIELGGPFTLTDHNGDTVTDKDFLGRHMLVFFGYTYCPDVCPTALQTVSDALDTIGAEKAAKVTPVFVSVDHQRDTPEMLKTFVGHFHPSVVGMTGTPDQIMAAVKAYRVFFAKVMEEGSDPDDYLIDHSAIIYLMGPDGKFVTSFSHGMTPAAMAERLAKIL